ncbi:hypothetical protein GEV33_001453 [Tenebrio molitor]|uniref:Uncharacterized protein n=1 Tax=Tenebrio molitor TaxID=7067 RepID=A0A8J6HW18_TENMO|nr:hypothetical protein GEV33_001453 [Tenebrio molitor]
MMLSKIESWEQKKNIMLNKSKLKERKGERMYLDDGLTNAKKERRREDESARKGVKRSKEMKTTRRRVEDAMKENKEDCILLGGDFNGNIGESEGKNWEENRGEGKKSKDNIGKCRGEESDGVDR